MINKEVHIEEFIEIIKGIVPTFSDSFKENIPKKEVLSDLIFDSKESITINEIQLKASHLSPYFQIIIDRICAVSLLLADFNQHQNTKTYIKSLKEIWPFIYRSIMNLQGSEILATIGSQGFLSIPLYHNDKKEESFEFLRLHIWHESLKKFIDNEKAEMFSIHSHQFYAQSRVLCGEIYNQRFDVTEQSFESEFSFFEIHWNNLDNVNQKTSIAQNTGKFVSIKEHDIESYEHGDSYEIKAGEYHRSTVDSKQLTATLFLFSTVKGRVGQSNVVGPTIIKESTVNRKITINAQILLESLNHAIVNNEGGN
ncbi:hypothetical protein [Chitinophaga ginsengisoli]|uniref:Uncharacterized protein n=1 Tax=Chitinophaga ginsengisoli TaxID=363837 RepID=A0A2P8FQS1_9BACT|nr:hypothetical protein [Chitinophaga ginsengisoli]PSL24078.1 hypothetical protein CLV42_11664 [Chitinophaga ginsengisoli]